MKKLIFFTQYYSSGKDYEGNDAYFITRIVDAAAEAYSGKVEVFCATAPPKRERLLRENIRIFRLNAERGSKDRKFQRLLKLGWLSLRFSWCAIRRIRRGDAVFTVTNPVFFPFLLAVLRKFAKFDYTLLVYDVFPENLVAAGMTGKNGLLYKFLLRLSNWSYRQADRVVAIGRDMGRHLEKNKGVPPEKIVFIPNWSCLDGVTPPPRAENPLLAEFGLLDHTVFLFAGNLGRVQGIDNFLKAVELVKSPKAAFLFVGDGAMKQELLDFQKTHPSGKLCYAGRKPVSEQPVFMSAGDVALITLSPGMLGLGVPSKSYSYMAMGLPLLFIGDGRSEIAQETAENRNGWIVPPGDPEALAKKIDEIAGISPEELAKKGRASLAAVEKYFSQTAVLAQYRRMFEDICSKQQI